jgi:hypothetical protein
MQDSDPTSDETKPPGHGLRTSEVIEMCSRCGTSRPRRSMKVVELSVLVPVDEYPEGMWVCVDDQSCILARTFPDLA